MFGQVQSVCLLWLLLLLLAINQRGQDRISFCTKSAESELSGQKRSSEKADSSNRVWPELISWPSDLIQSFGLRARARTQVIDLLNVRARIRTL